MHTNENVNEMQVPWAETGVSVSLIYIIPTSLMVYISVNIGCDGEMRCALWEYEAEKK